MSFQAFEIGHRPNGLLVVCNRPIALLDELLALLDDSIALRNGLIALSLRRPPLVQRRLGDLLEGFRFRHSLHSRRPVEPLTLERPFRLDPSPEFGD